MHHRVGGRGRNGLQFPFYGGDLAVFQPRGKLKVAVALRPFTLRLQLVELLFEFAHPVQAGLLVLPAGHQGLQVFAAVRQLAAQLRLPPLRGDIGLSLERELLHPHPVHRTLQFVDLHGAAVDFHPEPGAGLVDEVDRLVGQEAGRDVAVGQGGRRDQRTIGDFDSVMSFVAAFEPPQNRDGVLHRRLTDEHLLEAPFEGRVFLDTFAVFIESGRTDHAQLAASKHGLEHVAGVERPLGFARAHHGVQLVEEGNDLAVAVLDFLEDSFESLLEFAAIFCPGHHRAQVKADQSLVP